MSRKLDYHKMVNKVLKVDESAAEYLLGKNVKLLPAFKKSASLMGCFTFSDSPQGSEYWYTIATKIGE